MEISREQFDKLVQIYNALNTVTGQLAIGEPVTQGQEELFDVTVVTLFGLINEIEKLTPEEVDRLTEWTPDF